MWLNADSAGGHQELGLQHVREGGVLQEGVAHKVGLGPPQGCLRLPAPVPPRTRGHQQHRHPPTWLLHACPRNCQALLGGDSTSEMTL